MSIYRWIRLRGAVGVLGLLLILLPLAACGPNQGSTPAPTPTPTAVQFANLDLGIPAAALQSPVIGTVPDDTRLHVIVTFKMNQQVLARLQGKKVKSGQDTNLQNVANQLGISDATYAKIKAYFGIDNAVLKLGKLHTNLTIDARAHTFATLLQTHFVVHKYNGRTFFAPATTPRLPKTILDQIVAVTGLDNYSLPPTHRSSGLVPQQPLSALRSRQRPAADCSPNPQLLTPGDVGHAYGYDALWKQGWAGQNMTINLLEGDGYDPNDIQNYFDCVGFKGSLTPVDVDNLPPTQLVGEAEMDIEMIAGLAPYANIVNYQTDMLSINQYSDFWTLYSDVLTQMINDNVNNKNGGIVSISWGLDEGTLTTGTVKAIDNELQLLTVGEHMTVFIASGDCGAFDTGRYRTLSVDYPASDPYAVAVGGTILGVDRQSNRAGEIAWSDGSNVNKCQNHWGTGGGNSLIFARPRWQSAFGVNNSFSTGARQLPDVSAVAYGLAAYIGGKWVLDGGTSAAAPIWATGFLLVNQGLMRKTGYFYYGPDTFYAAAQAAGASRPFFDVTRGNNLYYPAGPGWDYTTGLGTPNLPDFFILLYKSLQS